MLQFITDTKSKTPVIDQILQVIEGGCRWIQIKMDDASDDDIRDVVEAVKPKCIETETFLLLRDRAELAKELNVGGVHLESGDISVSKARMLLGPAAVIGLTVNTFADILAVSALDIDYVAVAPFRKSDLDHRPELGLDGIREICNQMAKNKIDLAHVAAGGIKQDDILALLEAGVNGIAVSSAIAIADDIKAETRKFIDALPLKD